MRRTRPINWALLIWSLLRARSAMLPDIATQLPLPVQASSHERRLTRRLDNPTVLLVSFFAPVAGGGRRAVVPAGRKLSGIRRDFSKRRLLVSSLLTESSQFTA